MTIRLAVGLPAYRGVIVAQQALMWAQFGSGLAQRKLFRTDEAGRIEMVMHAVVDVCGVERARNMLVGNAMQNNAAWLLMMDSDTWIEPGYDLVRMIEEAPSNAALVGAAVRVGGSKKSNIYRWDALNRKHEHITLDPASTYQRVDAIGGAVIAINLKLIGESDFRWHYYENGSSISEDLWFCRQLAQLKRAIYVDTRIKTFHNTRPEVLASP